MTAKASRDTNETESPYSKSSIEQHRYTVADVNETTPHVPMRRKTERDRVVLSLMLRPDATENRSR